MNNIAQQELWSELDRLERRVDRIVDNQDKALRVRGVSHFVCAECGCPCSRNHAIYNGCCSECGGDLLEVAG